MGVKGAKAAVAQGENTPPTPATMVAVPTRDEFVEAVAATQASLAQAIEAAGLQRDPLRFVLVAVSDLIGLLVKTTRRWENATSAVVAAQHPLSAEERAAVVASAADGSKAGAVQGMREEARRIIRRFDHGTAIRAGLFVGGAYVGGALTVLGVFAAMHLGPFSRQAAADGAWREVVEHNPDPRPMLGAATVKAERATGRRYYEGVSLWLDPPRAPPASAATTAK